MLSVGYNSHSYHKWNPPYRMSFFFLCRNTVFNLSIHDLTEQQRLVWTSPEDDTKMCLVKGKDEVS